MLKGRGGLERTVGCARSDEMSNQAGRGVRWKGSVRDTMAGRNGRNESVGQARERGWQGERTTGCSVAAAAPGVLAGRLGSSGPTSRRAST